MAWSLGTRTGTGKRGGRRRPVTRAAAETLESRQLLSYYCLSGPSTSLGEGQVASYSVTYWFGSPADPGGTLSVAYSGSASAGSDYEALTTSLPLPPNPQLPPNCYPFSGTLAFTVPLRRDNLVEVPETLIVSLSGESGMLPGPFGFPSFLDATPYRVSTTTITDNPAQVSIARATEAQGADGSEEFDPATGEPRPLRFVVSRSGGDLAGSVQVSYAIAGSGANPADGQDYTSPGSSIEIPSGSSSVLLEIPVVDDDRVEAAGEGLTVTLTGGGLGCQYAQTSSSATGTIQDNDWEISSASVGFNDQGVIPDPGTVYTSPAWQDHDGNGSPSTDAGDAKAAPISYWRSLPTELHYITATPAFTLSGNPVSGWYHIKGTGSGPGGGTFEGDVQLQRNDTGSLHFVSGSFRSSKELPAVITKGSDLSIDWEITRLAPQQQKHTYGPSKNKVYVTGASAPWRYETIVALGCEAANDRDPGTPTGQAGILEAIWSRFTSYSVTRVSDGQVLSYWRTSSAPSGVGDLIGTLDGNCGAWASFMLSSVKTQGVLGAKVYMIQPGDGAASFRMKSTQFVGLGTAPESAGDYRWLLSETTYSPTLCAQGQSSRPQGFNCHYVLEFQGAYYDPSYGYKAVGATDDLARQDWENHSIDALVKNFDGVSCAKPTDANALDTTWTLAAQ